jgi:hypothetical protein
MALYGSAVYVLHFYVLNRLHATCRFPQYFEQMEELLLSAVQLLNVCGVIDVRQTEMHTAELLVPEPSSFEVKIAIEKLTRYKSPGIDQILAQLIQTGGNTLLSEIQKCIYCIWNKEELPQLWKESSIVPVYKNCDRTDCSSCRGISLFPTTYKIYPVQGVAVKFPE